LVWLGQFSTNSFIEDINLFLSALFRTATTRTMRHSQSKAWKISQLHDKLYNKLYTKPDEKLDNDDESRTCVAVVAKGMPTLRFGYLSVVSAYGLNPHQVSACLCKITR